MALSAAEVGGRLAAVRGSIYDVETLNEACGAHDVAVAFAYASKFQSEDGVYAERLSAALACSKLSPDAVVATVNRRLCAADGWEEAAPPLEGATPQEDSATGVCYFWRRAAAEPSWGVECVMGSIGDVPA